MTGLTGLGDCNNENIVINFERFVHLVENTIIYKPLLSESVSVRIGPLSTQAPKIFTFSIKKTCHKISPEKSYHKVSEVDDEDLHDLVVEGEG